MSKRILSAIGVGLSALLLTSCSGDASAESAADSNILAREPVTLICEYVFQTNDASSMKNLDFSVGGMGAKPVAGVQLDISFGGVVRPKTDGVISPNDFDYSEADAKKAMSAWYYGGFNDYIRIESTVPGEPELPLITNFSTPRDSGTKLVGSERFLVGTDSKGILKVTTARIFNPLFYAAMPAASMTNEIHCPPLKATVVGSPDGYKGFFDERFHGFAKIKKESDPVINADLWHKTDISIPQYSVPKSNG